VGCFIFFGTQEGCAASLRWKVTKDQVSRKASLPHGAFALQIRQNWGWKQLPRLVRPFPALACGLPFCKYFLCLAAAHVAIVLPDFGRNCVGDGLSFIITLTNLSLRGARAGFVR